ncbi:hypothetical protein KJ691_00705 [bacterium]|nr:hypothetical protein [bacterium]
MSKIEKIKKIILIALGFGLSTYLIINGMAILDKKEENNSTKSVELK